MIHRLLLAFLLFLFSTSVAMASDKSGVTVNQDNIKELIKTLESETARTEFINNLKTLSEADAKAVTEEEKAVPITQSLGINSTAERLLNDYRSFLAKNDLSGTMVGRAGLSLLALLAAIGAVWLLRRACASLYRRLNTLHQKIGVHHRRHKLYLTTLRYIGYVAILVLYIYSVLTIWNVSDFGFLKTDTAGELISGALSMFLVIVVGIAFWETISGSIDYGVKRASDRKAGRMRTLLPIVKSVLFIMFTVLFTLVLLSELGINILPLLAGAGIVGVAIGFGAQKMVQDFIGGFSIILEDLFHVGDVVMLAGVSGVVEDITLRKVQLRDVNGAVFTIPYSEITVIRNLTKDFSYYLLDMGVAYGEDTDRVTGVIQKVGEDMRRDEAYAQSILEPVEIMGVERFEQSAVVIRMRLKTAPAMQWAIGREFNRRLKMAFDENDIEIPFPQQTVYHRDDRGAKSSLPPRNTKGHNED